MSPKVSVVIVNWNGRRYLERCLAALEIQTFPKFEVIMVDNGSTDGSVEWVRDHFPNVRLICNASNLGFAVGNNQGIQASDSALIATLNNDTRVDPDWLWALVEVMEAEPTVGMCGSKLLFADRPGLIDSTGISMDAAGIAWDRCGGEPDDPNQTAPIEVFGPCAGAALYRRTMFDQIGLFDETFFAYLEDVDLAWRARLAGWRCLYVPAARVYHVHSGTAREGSPFKNKLLGRNKVWTIVKNYPAGRLALYWPLILLYDVAAVLYALFVRREHSALQGRLAALPGLAGAWRQRQTVQRLRRENRGRPWHSYLSPLLPPWRVPERYKHLQTSRE